MNTNTNAIANRRSQLKDAIQSGMPIDDAIAPGELLALAVNTDPLDFLSGISLLANQLDMSKDESEIDMHLMNNELFNLGAIEIARNTYMMDDVRKKRNQHKYENGLLADDEILAFALFLLSDSDLITAFEDYGEIEYDDISDLLNHVAARMKFLISCFANKRYDILNMVMHYARECKSENFDTFMVFPNFEMDDGGTGDYYNSLVDVKAYNPEYEEQLAAHKYAKAISQIATNGENATEDGKNNHICDGDDDEDICEDMEEPLVERDFEG